MSLTTGAQSQADGTMPRLYEMRMRTSLAGLSALGERRMSR